MFFFSYLYLQIFDTVDIKRWHPLTSCRHWRDSSRTFWLPFIRHCERLLAPALEIHPASCQRNTSGTPRRGSLSQLTPWNAHIIKLRSHILMRICSLHGRYLPEEIAFYAAATRREPTEPLAVGSVGKVQFFSRTWLHMSHPPKNMCGWVIQVNESVTWSAHKSIHPGSTHS